MSARSWGLRVSLKRRPVLTPATEIRRLAANPPDDDALRATLDRRAPRVAPADQLRLFGELVVAVEDLNAQVREGDGPSELAHWRYRWMVAELVGEFLTGPVAGSTRLGR